MRTSIENLFAIFAGAIIGTAGALVHNLALGPVPIGVIAAIAGSVAASLYIGSRMGRRSARFWFLLGWGALTLRASIFGNSDELLVMANGPGNAYLGLGFLLVLISIRARI
jgi:hypothetical protein